MHCHQNSEVTSQALLSPSKRRIMKFAITTWMLFSCVVFAHDVHTRSDPNISCDSTPPGINSSTHFNKEEGVDNQRSLGLAWVTDKLPDIQSRIQWDCNFQSKTCCDENNCNSAICDGYCGSASLQEVLLYYGAYVSQGIIRRTVSFNDKESAQDILIDTDQIGVKPDYEQTATILGLDPQSWYARDKRKRGLRKFLKWASMELKPPHYAPIAVGVVFQGSKSGSYDHIVTAIKGIRNGLWFYDHYRKKHKVVKVRSMPSWGTNCGKEYCFSRNMYAVSLRKPINVPNDKLVRLKVLSSSSGWSLLEPNWTCASVTPSIIKLEATVPFYTPDTSGKKQYVAIVLETNDASDIRSRNNNPFTGTPIKCLQIPSDPTSAQLTFDVNSNQAVYTKVVKENEGCPL